MHYLLPPALCSRQKKAERIGKNRGKNRGRKPSISDSRDTFLKFVKDEDVDIVIENRNIKCSLFKIKSHLFIVGYGSSKYKIVNFYVVIGDAKIRADNFVAALDLCFKMFILFNIPYPPESKAVWILLNKIFYNINVDSQMTARICAIYNDMNFLV